MSICKSINYMKNKEELRISLNSLVVSGLLTAALASCTIKADNLPPTSEASPVAPVGIPVDASIIAPKVLTDEIVLAGTILANQQVDIASELTRRVVSVNVKEGSRVRKGTLLFQLDNADLLAQLDKLKQQEKLALLNENRLRDLLAHDAIPQQDYDEVETNLKVLQAQINELQTVIAKTRIVAPFDGQIGMINTHPGAIVSTNTILTNIEDNSVVKVEFSVPEKYSNIIAIGSEQAFTTPADPGTFKTRVVAKAARLSTDTRTLLVRGVADNREGKLLPGQSARVALSLHTSNNALVVPSQALIPSPGGYSVFVSNDSKAELRPVAIGQRNSATVQVIKGLAPGDTLITSNLLRLSPGTPIHLATIQ